MLISLSSLILMFVDVEDGHTLHLVVRQPIATSVEQPGLICSRIAMSFQFCSAAIVNATVFLL